MFPKRAILRIGMLLRDSEVTKEVRTQLLNLVENSDDEVKVQEIDKETGMYMELMKASMTGGRQDIMVKSQTLFQYLNRHITELTEENEEVKADNKMLAAEILQWDDRKCINKAIRLIAAMSKTPPGCIWNNLYNELQYKHSISLRRRGKAPYIGYIKEKEWPLVQQSLAALCEQYDISPSYVYKRAKMESPLESAT